MVWGVTRRVIPASEAQRFRIFQTQLGVYRMGEWPSVAVDGAQCDAARRRHAQLESFRGHRTP